MHIFRKDARWSRLRVVGKICNVFVILALLFQPVGTAGLYGAFFSLRGIAVASDEEPGLVAEPVVEEEKEREGEEKTVVEETEEAKPESEEVPETLAGEAGNVVEPVVVAEDGSLEAVAVPEGDSDVPVVQDGADSGLSPEAPFTVEDSALVAGEDTMLFETDPVVTEEGVFVFPEVTVGSPIIDVTEEETVTEEDREASESDDEPRWREDGNKATTNKRVVLHETYVAPQNDAVTVTFTRLPEHAGTLTVEEVRLSAEQVATLGAFSATAYDITSSMENGTFEYILTLPIPEDRHDAQVKYATDKGDIEHAKTVKSRHVDHKGDTVAVTLDHFTLFVTTYGDVAFSVEQSEYTPGETVYVKATGLNDSKYYKIFINPPVGSSFSIPNTRCFNPDPGVTEYRASYTLPEDARISDDWSAELKEYPVSGCTGPTTISDSFVVVAPEAQQHIDITFCHATLTEGDVPVYEQMTTDDDGIMRQGHMSQHGEDIIPPFSVGETDFSGQNWTALGQAIWNNDCQPVGSLKVIKVVDDGSDLGAWSFRLDEGAPIPANASGEVDFGYLPMGEYSIFESGRASYGLMNVSGENCTATSETGEVNAQVVPGLTTVCTFNNAVNKGSITIIKEATVNDPQDFNFTVTNMEIPGFTLDDDGNTENGFSNSQTLGGLRPGVYSVTEQAMAGWELTDVRCTSSHASLVVPVSPTVAITLSPGEHVTCTYTNAPVSVIQPFCGDGIVNQESEQCDGTDGIDSDESFCTFTCVLVPLYEGGGTCAEGMEHVLVGSHFVSSTTDPDGVSIALAGGKQYVLEATGDYSYGGIATNHVLNRADAGYSSDDNFSDPSLLNDLFGIAESAYYRGTHALISDMGTGTFGVVDWGNYRSDHVYPVALTPTTDMDVRFMISDWYDAWYSGDWLSEPNKEQKGYRDNEGGLTVNVYECQAPSGSITVVQNSVPDSAQDFGYTIAGDGLVEFVLDDDLDPLLANTASFSNLPVTTYTVTAGLVPGFALESVACTSNIRSLDTTTAPMRTIDLGSGENVTCTFTTTLLEDRAVCGDGIVNQKSEQCDGRDGVSEGNNFCTFSCRLVPIYEAGGSCSAGSVAVLRDTRFVDATKTGDVVPPPVSVALAGGTEYLIEATGHFGYGGVPWNNTLNRADAGYASDSNWANPNLDTLFGSAKTALYRGIHTLISDMGTGTFGVVDWGTYNPDHVYTKHVVPATDTDILFAISDWYDTWYSGDELSDFNKDQYGFRDNEGGLTLNIYECQKNEEPMTPRLSIKKNNDSVTDEVPGNEVEYTIEVTALDGAVSGVTVTDVPPQGFDYVAGSGEGAPFIHEYASPGIWDLGDMEEGATRILTYRTKISDTQDAGLYRDLAFARGVAGETTIFANSAENPFVGTAVNVVLQDAPRVVIVEKEKTRRAEKTKQKTQYVLGASTVLPMTGADMRIVALALCGVLVGLGLMVLARRRLAVPVLVLCVLGGFGAFSAEVARAGTLSVQIETPEAQVQSPDFKIGFVTLDVLGRDLSVECYKEGNAVPFASYVLASSFGGNSGNCQVDATVMPADGDYEFYVKAMASGESAATVTSDRVKVKLASVVPGTPYNYDRKDASCLNTITFTTADDGGKTVKVELYRSLATTFVADATTLVAKQVIGSNVSGAFSVSAPNCSNDYFYALRAVEAYGNGSGFVGDTDVTVKTRTTTRTRTTTVVLPGAPSGALAVSEFGTGAGEEVGAVQGAETVIESGESAPVGSVGNVLGETDEQENKTLAHRVTGWFAGYFPWLAIGLVGLALSYYYFAIRSRKKSDETLP